MAKATLTLPDGTHVSIDGTPEEIARVMGLYGGHSQSKKEIAIVTKSQKTVKQDLPGRKGPRYYILELKQEGFFKQKKTLPEVQKRLEANGHIYAQNSLSTPLLRLVRDRQLRRLKEGDVWVYVDN
jgi:hypothetical protein